MYISEKKEEDLFNQNKLISLIDMDGSTTIHVPPGRSAVMITVVKGLFIFNYYANVPQTALLTG